MRLLFAFFCCLLFIPINTQTLSAQDTYYTKTGHIRFFSEAKLEDIQAENDKVVSFLRVNSGEMIFKVSIKSFEFPKSLMQKHFNEKYMYSDEHPNATFKGKVLDIDKIDFSKDGKHDVEVEGTLEIKGVEQKRKEKGSLEIKGDQIIAKSVFDVPLVDHEIKRPSIMTKNIAEIIEVTVDLKYEVYEE